jgi:WD40 repeat protein
MSRLASSRGRPKPKAGPSKKAPAAAAVGSHSVLWQRPFVNVFKSVRVGDWKRASRKGDASFSMNNGVRSYVVRVRGEVSASNLVTIPAARGASLNLHGRFAYIQLRTFAPHVWVMHLELMTTDKQVFRFSFGPNTLFRELHARGNSVRMPVRLSKKWTTLALDLPALLAAHAGGPSVTAEKFLCLKSVQMCSKMDVRNVFTSDELYRHDSLPKAMVMPVPKGSSWNQEYRWTWLPVPPLPPDVEEVAASLGAPATKTIAIAGSGSGGGNRNAGAGAAAAAKSQKRHFASSSALRSPVQDVSRDTDVALNRATRVLERMGKIGGETLIPSKGGVSARATGNTRRKVNDRTGRGAGARSLGSSSSSSTLNRASKLLEREGLAEALEPPIRMDLSAEEAVGSSSKHNESKSDSSPNSTIDESVALRTADLLADSLGESVNVSALNITAEDAQVEAEAMRAVRPVRISTLRPDPIMNLEAIIGYAGDRSNNVLWSADASIIAFPSNSIIVLMEHNPDVDASEAGPAPTVGAASGSAASGMPHQELLFGHTDDVCALAMSVSGSLLASAQQGKHPMVRLWRLERGGLSPGTMSGGSIRAKFVTALTAHASDLQCMDFSNDDRRLCVVGRDHHRRVQLVVWDVTRMSTSKGKGPSPSSSASPSAASAKGAMFSSPNGAARDPIVARQISEFSIERIKFSPYHSDRLVSCGRENIRFWRIRNGHLRGCPVILNEYARDTIFTDVAFESAYGPRPIDSNGMVQKRVFVSTSRGTVVQVNYDNRKVECVYRLHDRAIRTIAINEGYCVTGSDDKFLRVWPLDFSDYILEAQHEGPVQSVSVSQDGLRLAVGTSNGTVGVLDIATHAYKNVLRSHADSIFALAIDPSALRNDFATVAADRTIRVWSLDTLEQLYEFDSSAEQCRSLAFQPPLGGHKATHTVENDSHVLACGFDSGCVRIFQVPTTEMSHEYQQHRGAVLQLIYSPDGRRLYSAGEDGHICVYDVSRGYQPVKMVASDMPSERVSMAISPNGELLASVGPDARTTIVFQATSLMPLRKIRRNRRIGSLSLGDKRKFSNFHSISFSSDSTQLVATTDDGRLVRYDAATGDLLRETLPGLHRGHAAGASLESSSSRALSEKAKSTAHGTPVEGIQISPNGAYILTGGTDRLIKVWEHCLHGAVKEIPAFQSFVGHSHAVGEMHFVCRNGETRIISVGQGNGIYVWRFHGEAVHPLKALGSSFVEEPVDYSVAFPPTQRSAPSTPGMTRMSARESSSVAGAAAPAAPQAAPPATAAVLDDGSAYKADVPAVDSALAQLVHTIRRRGRLLSSTVAQLGKQLSAFDASRDGTISVKDFVRCLGRFDLGIHPANMQVILDFIASDEVNRVAYGIFLTNIKRISTIAATTPNDFNQMQHDALSRAGISGAAQMSEDAAPRTGGRGQPRQPGKSSLTSLERLMKDTSRASAAGKVGSEIRHGAPSLNLGTILGYSGPGQGNARNNVVWHPDTGLFGFSCGRTVVLEDLVPDLHTSPTDGQGASAHESGGGAVTGDPPSRQQTHMFGPTNDITLLCASPDGHIVAAAEDVPLDVSSSSGGGRIWLWDSRGRHVGTIAHGLGTLQTLSFGPYGKFLVAVGSYASGNVLVWSMADMAAPCASLSIGVQGVDTNTPPLHAIDMIERMTVKAASAVPQAGDDRRKRNEVKRGKHKKAAAAAPNSANKKELSFVAVGGRTVSHWRLRPSENEDLPMELVYSRILDALGGHKNNTEYFTAVAHCKPGPTALRFAVGGSGGSVWLMSANTRNSTDESNMLMKIDTHWLALDGGIDHISWRGAGDSTSLVVAGVSHLLQTWKVGPHVPSVITGIGGSDDTDASAGGIQQPTKDGECQLDGHVLAVTVDKRARDAVVATDSGTIWYVSSTTSRRRSLDDIVRNDLSPLVRSHTAPIRDICTAADGLLMATAGGHDGTIRVWHLQLLQTALTLDCPKCTSIAFPQPCISPMAMASTDRSATGSTNHVHMHILASGSSRGALTFFDLNQVVPAQAGLLGDRVASRRVQAHKSSIACMDYIACSATATSVARVLLVSGSVTGNICVTSPNQDDGLTMVLDSPHAGSPIEAVAVCPHDPSTWLVASRNSGISVWKCDASTVEANGDGDDGNSNASSGIKCEQLSYTLLRNLVDDDAEEWASASLSSARGTIAQKCPTLACFSPCESSVILCTTAAHPFAVLFYNYSVKSVVRTVRLPQWQWATSLSATVGGDQRPLIAAGLRSGRLAVIDYRTGETTCGDEALQGTPVGSLAFCAPSSVLCAASNNVVHVWQTK